MNENDKAMMIKTVEIEQKESPNDGCSSYFYKIISMPSLIFILVALAYVKALPINMEFHSVIIVGIIYAVFWLFVKHNACYSTCSFKKKKETLIRDINNYIGDNTITLMGKTKAIGSIEGFFDGFTKELRNDNFAAVAASIFPTLGILGTFISIAISMPDFGADSADALNNEITKLLGGVGTAFYASIYGIFLSLWWIFFEKKGFSYIQKEIYLMKQTFQEKLWSETELKRAEFIEQQSLSSELQNTIKQTLTPEFIGNMNETIKSQTSLLIEILQEDKALHEELRETYKQVVEKFSEITDKQDKVTTKLDNSIEVANQSYINLSENIGKLESLSSTFQLTHDAFMAQNESSKEIAQTLGEVSVTLGHETKTIVHSLEGVTQNITNSQHIMSDMTNKMLEVTSGISNLFEGLDQTTTKQNAVNEKLEKSIDMANQSYATLSDNVTKLESLSQVFQSNYEAITVQNESSKEIAQILGNVVNTLSKETKEIIESFQGVGKNLIETQSTMIAMSDALVGMSSGMQNILNGLNDSYKNTIEKQMLSIQKTVSSLETLYSQFHNNINNTLQSFESSAANIKSGGDQIVSSIKNLNLQTIGESISVMSKSLHALEGSMQNTSTSLNESVHKFDEQFIEKLRYTFKVLDDEIGKVLGKVGSATKALVDTSENIEDNLQNYNTELLERIDALLNATSQQKEVK